MLDNRSVVKYMNTQVFRTNELPVVLWKTEEKYFVY